MIVNLPDRIILVQPQSVMVGQLRGWTQSVAEVGTVWVEGRVDDCYRQGIEIGRSASQDGVPVAVRADVHVSFAHVLDVVDTLILGVIHQFDGLDADVRDEQFIAHS